MAEVTVDVRDGLGWVTIDNPPVNALGRAVRQGLWDAVATLRDADVRAVVLTGAGRAFVAGADIRELGQTPVEPYLPDVLAAIADAPVPWIAAINGLALGGGLEVAMACHARIAAPSAKLGLPEVNIGIIPGSGGTVRLPRLVPMATAIKLVTSGKPIGAQEALESGLVDRLGEEDLLAEATAMAKDLAVTGRPEPALARDLVAGDPIDWDAQEAQPSTSSTRFECGAHIKRQTGFSISERTTKIPVPRPSRPVSRDIRTPGIAFPFLEFFGCVFLTKPTVEEM